MIKGFTPTPNEDKLYFPAKSTNPHLVWGFTLIELLVVIAIAAILASFGYLNLIGYKDRQELDLTVGEIVATLRSAQERSRSQEFDNPWGVYFSNLSANSAFYDLFYGNSYNSNRIVFHSVMRSAIQFVQPALGATSTVFFSAVSGLPNASTTIIISLKRDPSASKTIIVNNNGQIQR